MAMPARALRSEPSAIEARIAALEARLDVLEAARAPKGPRDDLDTALVVQLAQTAVHRSFSCAEVLAHSVADAALRQALAHADIGSTKQLGKLLRRVEGVPIAGLRIARVGRRRWRVHTWDMAVVR
jgi:hypothetical protein